MASRLSDEMTKLQYETGIRGLPISREQLQGSLKPVDLDVIMNGPSPASRLQALPVQAIYQALKYRGLDDCAEILPILSREQFIGILDFDVWEKDAIVTEKAFAWLRAYAAIGRKPFLYRYQSLDEEYQLSLIERFVEVFDEEMIDRMPDELRDELRPLPCNKIFYRIVNCEPEIEEVIVNLIEAALENDMPYAYALLNHAYGAIRGENEGQLVQFRRARLEEEGFVSYQESLSNFKAKPIEAEEMISVQGRTTEALATTSSSTFLLDDAMKELASNPSNKQDMEIRLLHLANSLCAAAHLESDDIEGLRYVLLQARSLLNLGLEYESRKHQVAPTFVLEREVPKALFQTGLGLISVLQNRVWERLKQLGLKDVDNVWNLHKLGKNGLVLHAIDVKWAETLGLVLSESLKGLMNRFPTRAEFYSLPTDTSGNTRVRFACFTSLSDLWRFGEVLETFFSEQADELSRRANDPNSLH